MIEDDGDPDDGALLAALDTRRPAAWRALTDLADDFRLRLHAEDDYVWTGQYPQYGPRIEAARRLLDEVGAVSPAYGWMQHTPPALGADGTVSAADAVRLATTVVRAERFGDGNIAEAVKAGVLQAVVVALAGWYREQSDAG